MLLVALCFAGTAALHAGVRVREESTPALDQPVDAAESAALFVGIREFPEDPTLTRVEYAVDDAIDLAYLVAIERPLVRPDRVVLALSGEPQKAESKQRFARLKTAGGRIEAAGHTNILKSLRQQANAVGKNGLLIVAFATHGINDGGMQRLLTASSLLQDPEISVTDAKVRDIVSSQDVERALILIDACRERLTTDIRAGGASPRSAAVELMKELGKFSGHVVLSAAVAGQYAYDDNAKRNGVFTAAVLDGLRCAAGTDANGFVTVETLNAYVEESVLTWIQQNRDRDARRATQLSVEGQAARMPLSACGSVSGTARARRPPSD
jgi:hypothetical protein